MSRRKQKTVSLIGCLLLLLYAVLFLFIIYGFALFGLSLAVLAAGLALSSPKFRIQLWSQPGYNARLSRLPGLSSNSPMILSVSFLIYIIPLSVACWFLLSSSFTSSGMIFRAGFFGFLGIVALFGWSVLGWGLRNKQAFKGYSSSRGDRYFDHFGQLEQIKRLDPIAFERFVSSVFRQMGFYVEDKRATGDEGVDIVLKKENYHAVVQCKRYSGSVGPSAIRDLYGTMIHNEADEAFLVTTGNFSRAARRWAGDKTIRLVDGAQLVDWTQDLQHISNVEENEKTLSGTVSAIFNNNYLIVFSVIIALILPVMSAYTGYYFKATADEDASVSSAKPTAVPSTPTIKPTVTPNPLAGTEVILGRKGDMLDFGLWLLYEQDCSVDVTHYSVKPGTKGTLTGEICVDYGETYYKVSFTDEIRRDNQIVSGNTWVKKEDMRILR